MHCNTHVNFVYAASFYGRPGSIFVTVVQSNGPVMLSNKIL